MLAEEDIVEGEIVFFLRLHPYRIIANLLAPSFFRRFFSLVSLAVWWQSRVV
jgi:hypothetical protein